MFLLLVVVVSGNKKIVVLKGSDWFGLSLPIILAVHGR